MVELRSVLLFHHGLVAASRRDVLQPHKIKHVLFTATRSRKGASSPILSSLVLKQFVNSLTVFHIIQRLRLVNNQNLLNHLTNLAVLKHSIVITESRRGLIWGLTGWVTGCVRLTDSKTTVIFMMQFLHTRKQQESFHCSLYLLLHNSVVSMDVMNR